ncbi:transcription factor GTE12 isoform X1 [Cucumis melo var. makuwa]|uniref:Transcription factor GTE12 isoform X1 n=1 Tax=Cucumis melo var. makuwa TaxID=1194695 RepID=A0A5D3CN42_CUCMM|nr:transcription factor GTE12 isoform X1 [Cucumis melo var. makuwa]TYK13241.1 transcription factor GTE12 isoform X1 [Cucumis melo var. makuwa]
MIATETIVPSKKLKIKFGGKRVEDHPGSQSCEFGKLVGQKLSFMGRNGLKVDGSGRFKYSLNAFSNGKTLAAACCKSKSSITITDKRRATDDIESPREKKQKLDRGTTQQCSSILKTLMTHRFGWVFNQPVDPVALKIPDYFSIITDPMDLGTVKSKLERNLYQESEEFAADIRLTFSNAMFYNPPGNDVHKMAKELLENFEKKWRLPKEKWVSGKSNFQREKLSNGPPGEKISRTPSSHSSLLNKKSTGSEENVNKVDRAIPTCAPKPPRKNFHTGTETGSNDASSSFDKQTPRHKCSGCGTIMPCHCISSSNLDPVSSGDQSDERLSTGEPSSDQSLACGANSIPEVCSTPVFDVQLSPKKALRAAMLKSRFAETILKAQQKTLLDLGDKVDQLKIQQEKERLERRQREERERIEAQIKAADMALRLKAEAEKKQQRERDREAARIALQKIERTVDLDQNLEILKELERLCGGFLFIQHHRAMVTRSLDDCQLENPLERLGLFIKDEFLDDDEETIYSVNGKEGEIFSRS